MSISCRRKVACSRCSHKMSTSPLLMLLLMFIGSQTAAQRSLATSQELGLPSTTTQTQISNLKNTDDDDALDTDEYVDETFITPELGAAGANEQQFAPRFQNPRKMSSTYRRSSGSALVLNCQALGNPDPNITWYRNEVADWTRTYGNYRKTKWQLFMEDLKPEDSDTYTCKVCNPLGCLSHVTHVTVGDPVLPQPVALPGPVSLSPVFSQALSQIYDVGSQELAKDYDGMDGSSRNKSTQAQTNSNKNPEDDGLDNDADEAESSSTIGAGAGGSGSNDVRQFAPRLKNLKKMIKLHTRPSGSTLILSCPTVGNPEPNITWYRNGTADWIRTYGNYRKNKWQLYMDDLVPEDSDLYTCKMCNPLGCISYVMNVMVSDRVNHKPILLKAPANLTLVVKSNGHMDCKYLSDLTSKKAWFFMPCKSMNECAKNRSVIAEDEDRLEFKNVTQEQEGWYNCVESNSLGTSTVRAYLRVVLTEQLLEANLGGGLRENGMIVFVSIVTVGLFLLCIVLVTYASRKMKHDKLLKQRIETVHQWTKKVIIYKPSSAGDSSGSMDTMIMPVVRIEKQRTTVLQSGNEPVPFNEYEFPLDSNWELARNQLILGATLGEGAFGRVVMAEVNNSIVAVKMVKEGHTDDDIASLVREMEVMKIIGRHINIINLLGCCSQNGPLYVIVEYAPHGNLKDFLYKNRPLSKEQLDCPNSAPPTPQHLITEKDLIKFAHQIARGMDYLASRRCIHRDLAARNVLVSDDYVLKIADFGLARDIQSTDYYRKNTNGRLPIKWMAPESLQEKFYDSQSDVWSYGILLWEIMTFGGQPYPAIMSAEELYSYLMSGQRMEKPAKCSMNIYILMRQCWHFDASARPPFTEIVEYMDKLLQAKEDYLDVDVANLETPPSTSDEEEDASDMEQSRYLY